MIVISYNINLKIINYLILSFKLLIFKIIILKFELGNPKLEILLFFENNKKIIDMFICTVR